MAVRRVIVLLFYYANAGLACGYRRALRRVACVFLCAINVYRPPLLTARAYRAAAYDRATILSFSPSLPLSLELIVRAVGRSPSAVRRDNGLTINHGLTLTFSRIAAVPAVTSLSFAPSYDD